MNYNNTKAKQKSALMKKIILLGLVIAATISATKVKAQQDPMFTKYMFNTLIFNPAYAGSKEHMSITLLHRDQWWGLDGGPTTQTLTVHTPLKGNKIGIGGSLLHDDIGPTKEIKLNGYYAYRISFNDGKSKLSFGLSGGVSNWQADWSQLDIDDQVDPVFQGKQVEWIPKAGAGIFYYNPNFYIGLSAPNVLPASLDIEGGGTPNELTAQTYNHYYLGGGLILPFNLSRTIIFKPSFLIKNSNLFGVFSQDEASNVGAPTEFDIDVSLLFYEALWVGMSFRSAFEGFNGESSYDSADIWFAYFLRNGFRVGASFDYTLTELQQPAVGSFEIILGYEFAYKESAILTPRYFF